MNPLYPSVTERAGHRCEYCRAPEAIFNFPFEVEHILAKSAHGSDAEDNLALACRACNLRKHDHIKALDVGTGQEVSLFHPREHRWSDHFTADIASGTIISVSAIGRATVACLEMNGDAQLAARRQWLRLGLFP
ncbi:MAG: HNH endonuclease [Planctomycetes bacterium]|nr:HNH endonuclease [Planctomycetota bacterium]